VKSRSHEAYPSIWAFSRYGNPEAGNAQCRSGPFQPSFGSEVHESPLPNPLTIDHPEPSGDSAKLAETTETTAREIRPAGLALPVTQQINPHRKTSLKNRAIWRKNPIARFIEGKRHDSIGARPRTLGRSGMEISPRNRGREPNVSGQTPYGAAELPMPRSVHGSSHRSSDVYGRCPALRDIQAL